MEGPLNATSRTNVCNEGRRRTTTEHNAQHGHEFNVGTVM